jgi:ribosome-associated toxin RatA of RatAB toxin-antitoxin module
MPLVEVEHLIGAPGSQVWDLVNDVESYPRWMDHVRAVAVQERGEDYRVTAWEIDCKGFIMRWVEREEIDRERYRINYRQVTGDLAEWRGHWQIESLTAKRSKVTLSVLFDIGIPMLSEMLNPVAERAIQDNSRRMLTAIAAIAVENHGLIVTG